MNDSDAFELPASRGGSGGQVGDGGGFRAHEKVQEGVKDKKSEGRLKIKVTEAI